MSNCLLSTFLAIAATANNGIGVGCTGGGIPLVGKEKNQYGERQNVVWGHNVNHCQGGSGGEEVSS